MSETILKVQHLGKSFGNNEILKDIDFSVKPKDVTCIIGPSGSGKSTLLRCMNLLETPSSGEIRYHGTNIMDKHVNVPEYRSKVGMVFQNFNLFNNMTVLKNCTVGLEKVLNRRSCSLMSLLQHSTRRWSEKSLMLCERLPKTD